MRKNDSFETITSVLQKAQSIVILPHILIDGDAAGSAIALSLALRAQGKTAHILIDETLPDHLSILNVDGYFITKEEALFSYDVAVAVDCSDTGRFSERNTFFERAKIKINIDHHKTNHGFGDYHYVDQEAAATGEIIYDLMMCNHWEISVDCATALYVAIVTDTGQFQYSNTTAKTHKIAAHLYDLGIQANQINIALYQNMRKEKMLLMGEILHIVEFYAKGRIGFGYATREMMQKVNAELQDTDGFVETLRDIKGVEISIFVKEQEEKQMKIGLRTKSSVDATQIVVPFGGGGHARAAGCTIIGSIEEVRDRIVSMAKQVLENDA